MSIKPNGQGNKINKSSASSSSGQVSSSTSQKTSTSLQARLPQDVIPRTQGNRTIWGTIQSIFQNFRFSFYPYNTSRTTLFSPTSVSGFFILIGTYALQFSDHTPNFPIHFALVYNQQVIWFLYNLSYIPNWDINHINPANILLLWSSKLGVFFSFTIFRWLNKT